MQKPNENKYYIGLLTGITNTTIFHPIERAIYLSVKNKTPIYATSIWKQPYTGVSQNIYNRIINYGLLFPLNDTINNKTNNTFISGIISGSIIATATNPINIIKMQTWNNSKNANTFEQFKYLKSTYGYSIFLHGLTYSMLVSMVFTSIFLSLSHKFNKDKKLINDVMCASIASAMGSPIYYFRNRYCFDYEKKIKFSDMIRELQLEIKDMKTSRALWHIFHNRFTTGYNIARVSFGMATSKQIYEYLSKL